MTQPSKPRIQYVRSSNGVSLGAWKAGDGPPLVIVPFVGTDIQGDWDEPGLAWYRHLAALRTVVSFDARGAGASARDTADFSLDAMVEDLESVVDHFGLDHFPLAGTAQAGTVAIAYAVRHPERVSHLILFQSYANAAEFMSDAKIQATRALLAKDWDAFVETAVFFEHGWLGREAASALADHLRSKMNQETLLRVYDHVDRVDVTDLLPMVKAPTLVITRRRGAYPYVEAAKTIASCIPAAQLVITEGDKAAGWDTDSEEILTLIDEFARLDPAVAATPEQVEDAGLTKREIAVLRLVAAGHSNKEVAGELSLSVHTVERHLANIYAKIGARGRADAISYALKHGLA